MNSILRSAPRRLLHAASSLPYVESAGVGTFLSRKGLGIITELQSRNIDQLNSNIKGTALENLSLYQLMERTHKETSNVSLFANASQIWNNDFFLQGLCTEPVPIPDKLEQMIEEDFGSVAQFKDLFTTYAEAMHGSGWLWLVNDSPGPNEKLKIMCTFNTGSPFFQPVVPPTFNLSRKAFMPAATSSSGLFASFSFSTPSAPSVSSKPKSSNPEMMNNKIDQMEESKNELHVPIETRFPGTLKAVPVLGLSLWEHAYLLDYGVNKRRYIDNFWKAVNWNRVAIMLNVY